MKVCAWVWRVLPKPLRITFATRIGFLPEHTQYCTWRVFLFQKAPANFIEEKEWAASRANRGVIRRQAFCFDHGESL